jgi:cysteine desulfurase
MVGQSGCNCSGEKPMIYLDYNATTPMWPEVQAALMKAAAQPGNPSSVHSAGRAARAIVEHARDGLAHAMGVRARDLVFTSGGTEANALALRMAGEMPVLISAIEHESVLGQAAGATQVPVLADGTLDLAALEALIAGRAVFLSLMAANNETGVVQPVAAAAALVHQFGGLVHCDAVQLLGKAEFAAGISTADFISVSAHKIGGPQGVGALAVTCGLAPQPMLRGGTENVAGIAGFGAAVIEICRADWWVQCAALRDALEAALPDAARILSPSVARLPNTSNLWMAGVPAATQVMMLDLEGIAVSAGAACSSGKVKSSHVLRAMGLPENIAAQTIRVSLGWNTTAQEIEHFCAVWKKMAARAVATRSAA